MDTVTLDNLHDQIKTTPGADERRRAAFPSSIPLHGCASANDFAGSPRLTERLNLVTLEAGWQHRTVQRTQKNIRTSPDKT